LILDIYAEGINDPVGFKDGFLAASDHLFIREYGALEYSLAITFGFVKESFSKVLSNISAVSSGLFPNPVISILLCLCDLPLLSVPV
jgi:hypothetical protein